MYFYHGNKHYYLTRIFLSDPKLKEALYPLKLSSSEKYEDLCYALADELWQSVDDYLKNNGDLTANEFYDEEVKSKTSIIFSKMQTAISRVTGKAFSWLSSVNRPIYVGILESLLYGAIKHFFYINREKYLPQYDWYLINQNPKRKEIMEVLFLEFDKLATVADAIKYYQDIDDIPEEFIIRLQEITGFTMNTYSGIFSSDQLRNLTKHLIEVWREKGAIFSIELFFACMGIDCSAEELWFDRRLYFNTDNFNSYTKADTPREFEYYLTPRAPQSTTYSFSSENVNYSMYTAPKPSRVWEYIRDNYQGDNVLEKLLGYDDSEEIVTTFTFFKSNYLLLDFNYINQRRTVSKDEVAVFKELIMYMLPIYMRTVYTSDYGSDTGGDDWDILWSWDINESTAGADKIDKVTDQNNIERPVEIFKLFDTQNTIKPMTFDSSEGGADEFGVSYIRDAYPAAYCGEKFVSGSYIIVNDRRLEQFIEANDFINKDGKGKAVDNWKIAATGSNYEMVDGTYNGESGSETEEQIQALKCYPLFYDDEGHNYYRGESASELIKDDGQWSAINEEWIKENGTVGTLVITTPNDEASKREELVYHKAEEDWNEIITVKDKVTRYSFQVNGEDPVEIYPVLFADNENGTQVEFVQGYFDAPFYKEVVNPNSDDFSLYFEFIKTEDTEAVSGKTYYVLEDGVYKAVENPRGPELENYYEFVKSGGDFDPEKTYYIPTFRDETFGLNVEPQVDFTYDVYNTEEDKWETFAYDTFDQEYTNEPQNLFEASTWRESIPAINDLYNNGVFKGEIQYEYFEYSNPIQCLEANLNAPLEITLI